MVEFGRKEVTKLRLNPDCIRDILLSVEEKCDTENDLTLPYEKNDVLNEYSNNELMYHVKQCDLSGFFYGASEDLSGDYCITDLSPIGHEFLSNIRKDTVWNDVKGVANKVGSSSLKALMQISTSVMTELIKSQLGIT